MKLVFIHDGPVYVDEHKNYYAYSYHDMYDKYSYFTEDIHFVTRVLPLTKKNNCDKLDTRINIEEIPNFKSIKSVYKIKDVKRVIKNIVEDADMYVLRQSAAASLAFKYIKNQDKPFIYETVGCVWDSYVNHSFVGKIVALPAFIRTRYEIKNSPYVHYVTKSFLQKRYPTNGKSLDCSDVVIKDTSEEILKQRLSKIDNMTSIRSLVLGTAAAVDVKYKGQLYVIKAMKTLKEQGWNLKYMLVGTNASNSQYLSKIADKYGVADSVIYCGSLDSSEMSKFYDSLDVYIQPSSQEGLPRSVIEAMSRGCPCLGSTAGGTPELLDKQMIFKCKSIHDIISIINSLNVDILKKQSIVNFNRSRNFSSVELRSRLEGFYDKFRSEYEKFSKDND